MIHYFIPKKLNQKLNKSSNRAFRNWLDIKLRNNGRLVSPEEPNGYIIEKYHQPSAPRFIWKRRRIGDNEVLILRDFLLHDEYSSKYNTGTESHWNSMLMLSDEEEVELKEYYQSYLANENDNENILLNHFSSAESNFLNSPVSINPFFSKTRSMKRKDGLTILLQRVKNTWQTMVKLWRNSFFAIHPKINNQDGSQLSSPTMTKK